MIDHDPLDDAIDRTVRDMTHVAADDDAVARVMARLREADARATGGRWMLAPRVAWAGAAALLLVAIAAVYSLRSSNPEVQIHLRSIGEGSQVEGSVSSGATLLPSSRLHLESRSLASSRWTVGAVRETPTPAAATPSTMQVPELTPLESDIEIASITPVPLGGATPIPVALLTTTALTVDEIPVESIDIPPVSPEQHK